VTVSGSVAIIGAGLAGLGLARALLKAGLNGEHLQIFEAHSAGAGASGLPAALMHLTPGRSLFPKPGYAPCFAFSQAWLEALQSDSAEPLAEPLLLLRPALDAAVALRFERSYARLAPGLPAQISRLSATQTEAYRPLFALPEINPTYAVQPAWRVAMPALIQSLSQTLQQAGVVMHLERVSRLLPRSTSASQQGWQVQTPSGVHCFERVVLAVAADLPLWFPELPLQRMRGEVAVFRHPQFEGLNTALSCGGYVLPLGGQRVLAGPTFYPAEQPCQSPEWSVQQIRQGLASVVPAMAEAELEKLWSGVRTLVKHQREPLVGAVPGCHQLYVFSAFATKGLLQIPWLAQALAELLLQERDILPDYFKADRFPLETWRLACP
jgi:glycine/D-amino acid oxidase-like deaminating enzyme